MAEVEQEVRELDRRVHKLETDGAVGAERHASIVKRLDNIDGHMTKLMWLIITAIVGGFMTFMIKGGLVIA